MILDFKDQIKQLGDRVANLKNVQLIRGYLPRNTHKKN